MSAGSASQLTIQDQAAQLAENKAERDRLKEQVGEVTRRLELLEQKGRKEGEAVSPAQVSKLEVTVKEVEAKLELERTTKGRLESHIRKQTDVITSLTADLGEVAAREKAGAEEARREKERAKAAKEELAAVEARQAEVDRKRAELEKQLEVVEAEKQAAKSQLVSAQQRISSLQAALQGGDSDSEGEDMATFIQV